jgi:hypothetical protein
LFFELLVAINRTYRRSVGMKRSAAIAAMLALSLSPGNTRPGV